MMVLYNQPLAHFNDPSVPSGQWWRRVCGKYWLWIFYDDFQNSGRFDGLMFQLLSEKKVQCFNAFRLNGQICITTRNSKRVHHRILSFDTRIDYSSGVLDINAPFYVDCDILLRLTFINRCPRTLTQWYECWVRNIFQSEHRQKFWKNIF